MLLLGVVREGETSLLFLDANTHRKLSDPPLLKHSSVVHFLLLLLQSQEGRACTVLHFVLSLIHI